MVLDRGRGSVWCALLVVIVAAVGVGGCATMKTFRQARAKGEEYRPTTPSSVPISLTRAEVAKVTEELRLCARDRRETRVRIEGFERETRSLRLQLATAKTWPGQCPSCIPAWVGLGVSGTVAVALGIALVVVLFQVR